MWALVWDNLIREVENILNLWKWYKIWPGAHATKNLKIKIILTFSYLHYKS